LGKQKDRLSTIPAAFFYHQKNGTFLLFFSKKNPRLIVFGNFLSHPSDVLRKKSVRLKLPIVVFKRTSSKAIVR
jgi:hypothetical protein